MSQAVTKCPQCETTFRVTEAQLQVAKGKVRCGSCLHVFKAAEHWLTPPVEKVVNPVSKPDVPVKSAASVESSASNAGKFVFDQSSIDEGSAEKVLTKPSLAAVSRQEQEQKQALQGMLEKVHEDDEDEELLFSDDDGVVVNDTEETEVVTGESDYDDIFLDLDDLDEGESPSSSYTEIEDESMSDAGSSDESWAKDLLEDLEDDSEERDAHEKDLLSGGSDDKFDGDVFANDGHVKKKESSRDAFISDSGGDFDGDARNFLGLDKPSDVGSGALLAKIEPAPVEMEWQPSVKNWLAPMLWGSLCVLMLLLAVVQYGWLKFDDLAREKSYRPLYSSVCNVIGCNLPDLYNAKAIRSSNLVVRSHPTMPNILVVDTILQNTASYAQPFPELELYFNSLDDFPVASRRFSSAEYLAGELSGKKKMPPAKSIHISLHIVDPGDTAVNYRLRVSSKSPSHHGG